MERHTKQLHVRMTEREIERARSLAGELGMTVSDLVRALVQLPAADVAATSAAGELVIVDRKAAMRLDGEARRWGHHYNQAVHALNRIAYLMARDETNASDAFEELGRVSLELDALMEEVAPLRTGMESLYRRRLALL